MAVMISLNMAMLIMLATYPAYSAAANCPLRCPAGWTAISGTGNDHCYLMPEPPIMQDTFWTWQSYCYSMQPTSYIIELNTLQEYTGVGLQLMSYLSQFALTSYYMWIGAYYAPGGFKWLNGEPWDFNSMVINPLKPPGNGTCVYLDPKEKALAWHYHTCDDAFGATICEMSPLPDCSGTTASVVATTAYSSPDCKTTKSSDFVQQQKNGYLRLEELMSLEDMDATSCGVACMYYSGCSSFDISTSGECRLLNVNNLFMCGDFFEPDDDYRHYDRIYY